MSENREDRFKPALGLFDATAIGIGAIIGGGIFVVTGIVAGLAGPALVVSIVVAAIVALLTALSFVELTAWLPAEGSVYEFARRLVSPFGGFLTGWMWVVSNTFAGAAVSLGFSYYLAALLPSVEPKLIAAGLCAAFTAVNYVGVRQSAALNNFLVSAKVVILVLFVAVGISHINSGYFVPFIPSELGVLYGAYFIFFAYGGFARIAVAAEEVRDARRVVPRAIMLALTVSTVIYVLVGVVAVGLIGAGELGRSNSPLVDAIAIIGSPVLIYVVSLGGMMATASVLLTSILGVSRVTYAMARRDDLPRVFGRLHRKYNTPHLSILIAGAVMAFLVLSADLTKLVAVGTFSQLFYYGSANFSALRLKAEARFYLRLVQAIALGTCALLLVFVSQLGLEIGAVCLAIGAVYYVLKRKRTLILEGETVKPQE
jgi:APA family basic amino acid/polyamine antiporter